jgi:probable rRNA maturation factor
MNINPENLPMRLHLSVQFASEHADIPDRAYFRHWVKATMPVLPATAKSAELCIRIVDEAESTALNQTYRNKTGPTNILSFQLHDFDKDHDAENLYLGDIVLCAPVVFTEATAENKLALSHWAHLTVHGTLHLLGYDHHTDEDAIIMEGHEIKILTGLGFDNPY